MTDRHKISHADEKRTYLSNGLTAWQEIWRIYAVTDTAAKI